MIFLYLIFGINLLLLGLAILKSMVVFKSKASYKTVQKGACLIYFLDYFYLKLHIIVLKYYYNIRKRIIMNYKKIANRLCIRGSFTVTNTNDIPIYNCIKPMKF